MATKKSPTKKKASAKSPRASVPGAKTRKSEQRSQSKPASVSGFIHSLESERRRKDSQVLLELMGRVTGERAKLWGSSIIGFGEYHYRYESGRQGDSMRVGFSPRKQSLVLYVMPGFDGTTQLLERLGKHKVGKSCLYINKLEDVDIGVLEELVVKSYKEMAKRHPETA